MILIICKGFQVVSEELLMITFVTTPFMNKDLNDILSLVDALEKYYVLPILYPIIFCISIQVYFVPNVLVFIYCFEIRILLVDLRFWKHKVASFRNKIKSKNILKFILIKFGLNFIRELFQIIIDIITNKLLMILFKSIKTFKFRKFPIFIWWIRKVSSNNEGNFLFSKLFLCDKQWVPMT